jgi:RNA recognition motif-containing protein
MQGSNLYVGNLDYSTTREQLEELFSEYGEVKEVKIIEGRGFGFVRMASAAEAENAQKALNGADFMGRTLKIDEARSREDRPRRGFDSNRGRQRGGYSRS